MANQSISAWTILPFNTAEEFNLFKNEGWAQLTQASQNPDKGTFESKDSFNLAGRDIHLEFEYLSWGGTGGQGLVIYLFDATAPGAGSGGIGGVGLSYVKMVGAYMGIGLDDAGNFSIMPIGDMAENAKDAPSVLGNVVTVRGSQARNYASNGIYPLPASIPLTYNLAQYATRQQVIDAGGLRYVALRLVAHKNQAGFAAYLRITGKGGALTKDFDYPYAAPSSLKLGLAATNGGARSSNHEVRNVKAALLDPSPDIPQSSGRNLLLNALASIEASKNIRPYPFLTNGDRVHAGTWGAELDRAFLFYHFDFGAPVEINTLVIYSRQDDGTEREPSDSATFSQHGTISFGIYGEIDNRPGALTLGMIFDNDLVKRTITFPRTTLRKFQIGVIQAASTGSSINEVEAYNL